MGSNTVRIVASGFSVVIPAEAGIHFAVDLPGKVKMDPSVRWGDDLMVCRLREQHWNGLSLGLRRALARMSHASRRHAADHIVLR
jgi:hypothetical protein